MLQKYITCENIPTYLFLPGVNEFLMRFCRVACNRDWMIDASFMASSCKATSSAASPVSCTVSAVSGCWQSSRNLSDCSSVFTLFTLLVWSTCKPTHYWDWKLHFHNRHQFSHYTDYERRWVQQWNTMSRSWDALPSCRLPASEHCK